MSSFITRVTNDWRTLGAKEIHDDIHEFIRERILTRKAGYELYNLEDLEKKQKIVAGGSIRHWLEYSLEYSHLSFEDKLNLLPRESRELLDEYLNFAAAYGVDVSKFGEEISLKGGKHKKLKRRRRGSKRRKGSKRKRTSKR